MLARSPNSLPLLPQTFHSSASTKSISSLSSKIWQRHKPINFSNSPKLEWNSIQASLVLPVLRNWQNLLQTTMVQPKLIRTNLQFHPTTGLLEAKTRCTDGLNCSRENRHRVCSTVLRPQIHLPTTDSHSFEEPEAIIWKIWDSSLITQIRVDYSMKMSATCESFLPAIKATILSCLITWTVIGDLLEKFCKAVMMRMSMQFSVPRERSTS